MQQANTQSKPVWTVDDWVADRCTREQLGKPKPNADLVQETLSTLSEAPSPLSVADLRQDVLKAYKELGGVKYLMQNPALLAKLLVKIAGETKQTDPTAVTVNISWLSSDRLAYREGNVVDIAPAIAGDRAIESAISAPEGWKSSPPEQGLAYVLREDAKE